MCLFKNNSIDQEKKLKNLQYLEKLDNLKYLEKLEHLENLKTLSSEKRESTPEKNESTPEKNSTCWREKIKNCYSPHGGLIIISSILSFFIMCLICMEKNISSIDDLKLLSSELSATLIASFFTFIISFMIYPILKNIPCAKNISIWILITVILAYALSFESMMEITKAIVDSRKNNFESIGVTGNIVGETEFIVNETIKHVTDYDNFFVGSVYYLLYLVKSYILILSGYLILLLTKKD